MRTPREEKSDKKISIRFIRSRLVVRNGLFKSGESLIDTDEGMRETLNRHLLTNF